MSGVSASRTVAELERLSFTHALVIPDSESRLLFDELQRSSLDVISPSREGESIAIAAGLWTGGAKPVVVIQNTGLMEAGDSLRGCGVGPRIPLRLMVGWRGYPAWEQGRLPVDSAHTYTLPILDAWGIGHTVMKTDDDLVEIERADRAAERDSMPVAVLTTHAFAP